MGFNANSSDKPVVQESKLYTGLYNMKVAAINPNKAQLEEMGYKPQNDPVYISKDDDGTDKVRLDFFLVGDAPEAGREIRTKIAFFLENKHRVNKDGNKAEWINDFGRTAWGTPEAPPTGLKWFDNATARPSKVGEYELHLFLINWLNIQPGDEAKLDNFNALFAGNYGELLALLNANKNNEIRVLLTVRDGKYQSVYNRYFDRATNNRTTYWESHIKKQSEAGYPPKEDFQNDLMFKEWTEPSIMSDMSTDTDTAATKTAEDDPF